MIQTLAGAACHTVLVNLASTNRTRTTSFKGEDRMKHSSGDKHEPPPGPPRQEGQPSEEEIRELAYQLYQESGCAPGHDLQHWLDAEQRLLKRGYGTP
ncbi:MAG: DUF2934 domain-containing protein [Nitrospira sp.]|nr:MAG: DUF2934 domain-containing protein [Nitrospira sp.]